MSQTKPTILSTLRVMQTTWTWRFLTATFPRLPKSVPVFSITDKVPCVSQLSQHRVILIYACTPIILQQALMSITGSETFNTSFEFILYFYTYQLSARHQGYTFRKLALQVGYFDGDKHQRDNFNASGKSSGKIICSLARTAIARTGMPILLSFQPNQSPVEVLGNLTWWIWAVLNITFYSVTLDFWYYLVHRAALEVPYLWKFHRAHHTTKHPNMRLTAYTDTEQEIWDMLGAPILAYATLRALNIPFDFFMLLVCLHYIVYTEVSGHSGLRILMFPPLTFSLLLSYFDAKLSIEDHDLHHRYGWRVAKNYGKQTRVWNRVFGTCSERLESNALNINYENRIKIPFC
ncbi:hypothetical protein DER46DRAFT_690428 [Fusarium sp. MPI-SDFR-AT-0072]|nr:hypothetical protein DER46DRAFT_690428 [Fusarium sp. MPI-SDFR-AT-0072]